MMKKITDLLTCSSCLNDFRLDKAVIKKYIELGYTSPPKLCDICRKIKNGKSYSLHKIKCKHCGEYDYVPFIPINPKTVLCEKCFLEWQVIKNNTSFM